MQLERARDLDTLRFRADTRINDLIRDLPAKTLTDKPTARAHAYGLLHALCASAVEDELLIKNPCQIKRAMSTNRKREPVFAFGE